MLRERITKDLTMNKRLFVYMLILLLLIIAVFVSSLSFLGKIVNPEKIIKDKVDFQLEIFENDIAGRFDNISAMGLQLSEELAAVTENYLDNKNMYIDDLKGNKEAIKGLERKVLPVIKNMLFRAGCSGAFVMYEASVDQDKDTGSRCGIYLNRSDVNAVSEELLMYRGDAQVGKEDGIMLHRKWRLEYDTDKFPGYIKTDNFYNELVEEEYIFTEPAILTGTSDEVILLLMPVAAADGRIYGVCGLEINERFFKYNYAQPAALDRVICAIEIDGDMTHICESAFCCGVKGGYYSDIREKLEVKSYKEGLSLFRGKESEYVGVIRTISLSGKGQPCTIAAMVPKKDFDYVVVMDVIHIISIIILMATFAVACCYFFSRRFMKPVLSALSNIKHSHKTGMKFNISEIDDLVEFLSAREKEADEKYEELIAMHKEAEDKAKDLEEEIRKLAVERKNEIGEDEYSMFVDNLASLTAREREVFELYAKGMKAKDIIEVMGFTQNALKFHNRNIYSKLGVSSRKELLTYIAVMEQEEKNR